MIYLIYLIIFFILSLLVGLYMPKLKGIIGEYRVSKQFEKLELEGYRILNNIMLPSSRGTSQIDHVILSPYGIFVVETKNYKGWIFGSEYTDTWTQVIYNKKTRFKNPIKQNYGHIAALKEVLKDYKDITFIPIIIFAGSAQLKKVDTKTDVIYPSELYSTILNHRGVERLNSSILDNLYRLLCSTTINDKKSRKLHNKTIKARSHNNYHLTNSGICPKCKGKLLLRSGRYGEFYGCSNYPKCSFKANVHR